MSVIEDLSFIESGMRSLQESFVEIESLWGQVTELERCVCDSTIYVRQWLSDLATRCPVVDSATLSALMERLNEATRVPLAPAERAPGVSVSKKLPSNHQRRGFGPTQKAASVSVSTEKQADFSAKTLHKQQNQVDCERRQVRRLLARLENTRFRTDVQMEAVLMLLWRNQPDGLYVHDLMRETGMSRMRLNTYLHALVKNGMAEKYARKGLVYALRAEQ